MMKYMVLAFLVQGASLLAGDLQLDMEQSWVRATAHATGHSFQAIPERFECSVVLDAQGDISGAAFSFSVADLLTGKKKRDKEMWHWLESDKFPKVSFVMTDLKEENGQQVIVGNFTLHNEMRVLEFPVNVKKEDGKMQINGEVTLDTTLFKLPIIRKMGIFKVKANVKVAFQLLGQG